jgi:hypothetical protein
LFQDNKPPSHVILKRVQDDELWDDAIVIGVLSLQTYTQNAAFL